MREDEQKGAKHILVVDDEIANRTFVKRLLQRYGLNVSVASSVEEALDIFIPGKFDAAVIDIDLGSEINGVGLVQRLQALTPDFPVILMSGDQLNEAKVQEANFKFFVLKPFRAAELMKPLSAILQVSFGETE